MATQSNTAVQAKIEEGGVLDVVIPHVSFDGNCRQALEFYKKSIGGEITMLTWDQMPAGGCDAKQEDSAGCEMPQDAVDKAKAAKLVMHGRLNRGGHPVMMVSDVPPGMPLTKGNNFWLSIACKTEADINRVFNALGENGKVWQPLQETFFAQKFGMATDQFGVNWMVIFGEKAKI